MSTYLVTGAAGFIASKVCEFLLAEGHTVVGVDNLNDYYDVRLKYYRLARLAEQAGCAADQVASLKAAVEKPETGNLKPEDSESNSGPRSQVSGLSANPQVCSAISAHGAPSGFFASVSPGENRGQTPADQQVGTAKFQVSLKSDHFEFLQMDIEDLPALDRLFARSDFTAVFNLAARAGVRYSMENPHVYLSTNTLGTLNILECMRKHGVKKQVLASTSSLYAGCPMPFTEDLPVNTPLSPYAATKKGAELMAYSYHKLYGLDTTVVRYFTVFGPAGRPDMAPYRFMHWVATGQPVKLFGDGSQSRDFTYVDDIARGTILAAKPLVASDQSLGSCHQPLASSSQPPAASSGFEIINLGGGNRPITINAMIAVLEQYLGRKAIIERLPVNPVDMTETWADITKAGRLLGWKPQVTPEQGFQLAVDWHLANREWLKDIKL